MINFISTHDPLYMDHYKAALTRDGTQVHAVIQGGNVAGPRRSARQLLEHHGSQIIDERGVGVQRWYSAPVLQQQTKHIRDKALFITAVGTACLHELC